MGVGPDAGHTVGDQVQVHLVVVRHQLFKLAVPHHKTLTEFQIDRFQQIASGQVQVGLQLVVPDLELLMPHPALVLRGALLPHADAAGAFPPV